MHQMLSRHLYWAKGQQQVESFVKKTLSSEGTGSFYSPVHRSGLLTFADMAKSTKFTCGNKTVDANVNAEVVFRRALTIAKVRKGVQMDTVLSRPITAVPTALFSEDGMMRKTNKAQLCHILESQAKSMRSLPL